MRIVINPGHLIGTDPGAVGEIFTEAQIAKTAALAAADALLNRGVEVLLIQSDSLYAITAAANSFRPDAFVSLHCNAALNRTATGSEAFAMSAAGEALAALILAAVCPAFGTVNRGVKDGSRLFVVRDTTAPAVLVELGFISNPAEEKLLAARAADFGQAAADAIWQWLIDNQGSDD